MGSELVVKRWCDRCRGPEAAGFRAEIRLTIGPDTDRVLDLCRVCFAEILEPVVEALGELGEVPKVKGKGANVAATQVASQPELVARSRSRSRSNASEDRSPCPFCPASSASENGLKQHLRIRHGLLWSQYQQGQRPTRGEQQEAIHGAA